MEETKSAMLVGYHHFQSKDKTKTFYIVQCLIHSSYEASNKKGILINVFVNQDEYAEVTAKELGEEVLLSVKPNFEKGTMNYKIVL